MCKRVIFNFLFVCLSFVIISCASNKQQPVQQKKEVKKEVKEEKIVDAIAEFNKFAKENPIYFEFDSAKVNEKDVAKLYKKQLKQLNEMNDKVKLSVNGYCDPRGSVEYNNVLGSKRANAVSEIAKKFAGNKVNVNVVSFGKSKYKEYTSNEEDNYRMNRKVEVVASK